MTRHEGDEKLAAELRNVSVRFGAVTAVDGVSMTVAAGTVYALLGRNGSGKSTSVRCLLGQLRPQAGSARLLGMDSWHSRRELMGRVGVVPENPDAPPEMSPRQIGRFLARLYQAWDGADYDNRLSRYGIPADGCFRELSKGQRRHVSLAIALATSPEMLILDDPTLGLDPVARAILFDEVIAELADRGITVLITTHDLAGIEGVADHVGIMHEGRLVVDEELEALKARFRRVRGTVADNGRLPDTVTAMEPVRLREREAAFDAVVGRYDTSALCDGAFEVGALSLEDIFIALVGEQNGGES